MFGWSTIYSAMLPRVTAVWCLQSHRYDLLSEEDPEEFVNVEIPSDLRVSDDSVVPQSKGRPRSKLLSALKKPPQRRKKPMEPIQDISQVCMCVWVDELKT